jgi:hypothetical protein
MAKKPLPVSIMLLLCVAGIATYRASGDRISASNAKQRFVDLLASKHRELNTLTAEDAVRLMTEFYATIPARANADKGQDMLLYQWGTYQWTPESTRSFEFDITRQIADGDDIAQLSLTLHYKPSPQLEEVASGNRWCHSRDEIAALREFVSNSVAMRAVERLQPETVTLNLEHVD